MRPRCVRGPARVGGARFAVRCLQLFLTMLLWYLHTSICGYDDAPSCDCNWSEMAKSECFMAMRDDDVVDIRKARRNVSITLMCWVELSAGEDGRNVFCVVNVVNTDSRLKGGAPEDDHALDMWDRAPCILLMRFCWTLHWAHPWAVCDLSSQPMLADHLRTRLIVSLRL